MTIKLEKSCLMLPLSPCPWKGHGRPCPSLWDDPPWRLSLVSHRSTQHSQARAQGCLAWALLSGCWLTTCLLG